MKDYRDMTYLQAVEIERRMLELNESGMCLPKCHDCPFFSKNSGISVPCSYLRTHHPERYLEILAGWDEANPRKTILQDFLEKHPKAEMKPSGLPIVCPSLLGYEDYRFARGECNYDESKCADCWNQPLEE